MILVKSSGDDSSTMDVLDWIFFSSDKGVVRLNDNVGIAGLSIRLNDKIAWRFRAGSDEISSRYATAYWYRRGRFSPVTEHDRREAHAIIADDTYDIISALNYALSLKDTSIGNYEDNRLNKIEILIKASAAGLKIPDTLVTDSVHELNDFCNLYDKIITKPVTNSIRYTLPVSDSQYEVSLINKAGLIDKPAVYNKSLRDDGLTGYTPSLYQEYIEKRYELRILYILGQFFSMAIFSQQNEKTKIDYRNYDTAHPNRCVPYQLPGCIRQKLHALMQESGLKFASIDMIYSIQGEYVFLEVNPIGQYQWLEGNCNYPVSKLIAGILINKTDYGAGNTETAGKTVA